MEQVIVGGYYDLLNVTDTEYNRLAGGDGWNATEADVAQLVSTDGKLKNLRIELNDVPGTGTYVFTVRLNGAPTTLTCEVAADGTTASDTTHEVTVAGGDRICLECNPDSPDNARYARWTVIFKGDTAKESLILGGSDNVLNDGATEYNQIAPTGGANWHGGEVSRMTQVIPTAGKIKNLYVKLSADPGDIGVDAYRFTLRLDSGAGFGDTALAVTITADDTTGNNTVNEITVAAGDKVTLQCEPLNAPGVEPYAVWGMTFVADTDCESIILGGSGDLPSTTVTEYLYLTGRQAAIGTWTATEAERLQLGQACTLKKLYVELETDPDPGSYTFTLRKPGNGQADGNLTVTITTGNTTGNDTAHTDVISDGDELDLESTPADSPSTGSVFWGLVSYRAPPVGLENKSANMAAKMIAGKLI